MAGYPEAKSNCVSIGSLFVVEELRFVWWIVQLLTSIFVCLSDDTSMACGCNDQCQQWRPYGFYDVLPTCTYESPQGAILKQLHNDYLNLRLLG